MPTAAADCPDQKVSSGNFNLGIVEFGQERAQKTCSCSARSALLLCEMGGIEKGLNPCFMSRISNTRLHPKVEVL